VLQEEHDHTLADPRGATQWTPEERTCILQTLGGLRFLGGLRPLWGDALWNRWVFNKRKSSSFDTLAKNHLLEDGRPDYEFVYTARKETWQTGPSIQGRSIEELCERLIAHDTQ
jgi:hypothetical protein